MSAILSFIDSTMLIAIICCFNNLVLMRIPTVATCIFHFMFTFNVFHRVHSNLRQLLS